MLDEEFEWLNRFSGGKMPKRAGAKADPDTDLREAYRIARANEEISERAMKDNMLDSAFQALADKKDIIRQAFDFEVEVSGRKIRTLDAQKEAFDTEQTRKITAAPQAGIVRDAYAMKELLVAQKDRLAAVTVTRSRPAWKDPKKPGELQTVKELLFTETEITSQFYGPLEREMVIPDNFVTGKFSPTQKMLDETNDLYIKECQEKGGRRETGAVALSKAALNVAASFTEAITGFSSTAAPQTEGSFSDVGLSAASQDAIQVVTEGVQALVGVGIDVTDVAIDTVVKRSFSASQWQTALNNLAVGVAKTVAGALGTQAPSDPTAAAGAVSLYEALCDGISGGLSGATAIAILSKWAADGADFSKFPVKDIVLPIINAVAQAGSATGDENSPTTQISEISNGITGSAQAITATVAASSNIRKQFEVGDYAAGIQAILRLVGQQVSNVVSGAIANYSEDDASASNADFKGDIQPLQAQLAESDAVSEILSNWETADPLLVEAVRKRLGSKLDARMTEAEAIDASTIEAEAEAEKKAYQQSLDRLSKNVLSENDFKTINGLIEDIKRKRAIINLALSIVSGGFGVAGGAEYAVQIIARGLKATGDLAKAVKSVISAIECVQALSEWIESYNEAITSASPYASAIENFINDNRELLAHNTVQALFSLAKALAGYASIAIPPMASAGLAMDAAASTANFVFQVYRQAALDRAWKQTVKSLKSPNNRQLALVVRELNPTLAKYTIAYGAFVARDPIAVRAVDRIGLDRETLANPNSKVNDVKNYLETLYKDSLKLVAEIDSERGRVRVPVPELTVKAWSVSYQQWAKEQKGSLPIKTPNPPEILSNLERVEVYRSIKDEKKRETIQPQLLKALAELDKGFTAFDAVDSSGSEMPDVEKVAKTYAQLARAALESEQLNSAAAISKAAA